MVLVLHMVNLRTVFPRHRSLGFRLNKPSPISPTARATSFLDSHRLNLMSTPKCLLLS
jgi:hypothetical protein